MPSPPPNPPGKFPRTSAPQDRDGHLPTVLLFLGFSSLNARENSQRSLLAGVFCLCKSEDKFCWTLFKTRHWLIFPLLLGFFFQR